jgi:hypothetical protein
VREAASLRSQNAIVGIIGWILRGSGSKRRALFHAQKNEIDPKAIPLLHLLQIGTDEIFFANSLFGPLHRDLLLSGVRFHPLLVFLCPLTECLFRDGPDAQYFAKKVHHQFRP